MWLVLALCYLLLQLPGLTTNTEGIPQTFAERVNERREVYPRLPDCGEKLETRNKNTGRTQRDALRQILIFNLAGFRITMETRIWVFSKRFD